jgi:YD repeat-containing protein
MPPGGIPFFRRDETITGGNRMTTRKVLRRNDGKTLNFGPESEHLAERSDMRVIELAYDDEGRLTGEVDLTRLHSETTERALREAIARKWPYLVALIDRPEVCKTALAAIEGAMLESKPATAAAADTTPPAPARAPKKTPAASPPAKTSTPASGASAAAPKGNAAETDPAIAAAKAIDAQLAVKKQELMDLASRELVAEHVKTELGADLASANKPTMIRNALDLYRAELTKPASETA